MPNTGKVEPEIISAITKAKIALALVNTHTLALRSDPGRTEMLRTVSLDLYTLLSLKIIWVFFRTG